MQTNLFLRYENRTHKTPMKYSQSQRIWREREEKQLILDLSWIVNSIVTKTFYLTYPSFGKPRQCGYVEEDCMISLDVGHFPDVDDNVVEILSLYPNTSFLSPPSPPPYALVSRRWISEAITESFLDEGNVIIVLGRKHFLWIVWYIIAIDTIILNDCILALLISPNLLTG